MIRSLFNCLMTLAVDSVILCVENPGCEEPMPSPTRILIVDDSSRARASLRALLDIYDGDTEIQEASSGVQALQCLDEAVPDVVFMDIMMEGLDGLETTQAVKRRVPHIKVVAMSIRCDFQSAALEAGADAFVCKTDPPRVLLDALARVAGLREDISSC